MCIGAHTKGLWWAQLQTEMSGHNVPWALVRLHCDLLQHGTMSAAD